MQNKLGQMKATLNDFIKKPWKVNEDSGPQTKFRNKRWVTSIAPSHGEGKNSPKQDESIQKLADNKIQNTNSAVALKKKGLIDIGLDRVAIKII